MKTSKQGTKRIAGIGGVCSQAFYGAFSAVQNWIGDLLLLTKVSDKMVKIYGNCPNFAKEVIDEINTDQVAVVCKDIDLAKPETLKKLIDACGYEFGS